eukprot:gene9683-biopygen3434
MEWNAATQRTRNAGGSSGAAPLASCRACVDPKTEIVDEDVTQNNTTRANSSS